MATRVNYRKMYFELFSCLLDVLKEIDNLNFGQAKEIIKKAQLSAEEIYMSAPEAALRGTLPSGDEDE